VLIPGCSSVFPIWLVNEKAGKKKCGSELNTRIFLYIHITGGWGDVEKQALSFPLSLSLEACCEFAGSSNPHVLLTPASFRASEHHEPATELDPTQLLPSR